MESVRGSGEAESSSAEYDGGSFERHGVDSRAWRCTRCGAETIQKLSLLHAAGSTSTTMETVITGAGKALSGGTVRVGEARAESTGSSTTGLAELVAPPAMPEEPGGIGAAVGFVAGIGGCFGGSQIASTGWWMLLPFVLGVLGAAIERNARRGRYERHREEYEKSREEWEESYLCHRCGTVFRVA